tara:strand:+ start:2837 stop:3007 length:171 start_codon:yes stop_codon:yes gene_type:complete
MLYTSVLRSKNRSLKLNDFFRSAYRAINTIQSLNQISLAPLKVSFKDISLLVIWKI